MSKFRNKRWLLACSVLLGACASAPVPPRYFTLSSGDADSPLPPPPAVARYGLAVGPVTLPEALDRPQIVLRSAPNRYLISDDARWAEPLKMEIPRLLADRLRRALPAARVATRSQSLARDADYQLRLDVQRLELRPGEAVVLEADWSVGDRNGHVIRHARAHLVEAVDGPGIEVLVAAQERLLNRLGHDLALGIADLPAAAIRPPDPIPPRR